MDNEGKNSTERLAEAMERANNLWHTFGKGIVFGLGSTLGVAIIIVILVYVLKQAQFVPWVGGKLETFLTPIAEQLQKTGAVK